MKKAKNTKKNRIFCSHSFLWKKRMVRDFMSIIDNYIEILIYYQGLKIFKIFYPICDFS